ncbi:dipeptide epimerase [Hypericibacter terrae]|jgi:L-alanine-DL-glutamate epimerase-like enolase superfamily enzyme|uniref:Dipeptide epimerase n=1 Tax=Hypericibacter terrae TaxID=2602015 RepID=A0A5J6MNJ7_9PROT|nr:N-acetyl-D-Glu racemase DgcA [Hypericibacter terrae]QEX18934.1 dipeptide epimerase [Hypericibacter terrae]
MAKLETVVETWPLAGRFTISRGSKTEARVVVAMIQDGGHAGRGECVPYARYGESLESVVAEIDAQRWTLERDPDRGALQRGMKPGAARNALDCALWDLEAKRAGRRVWDLAGLPAPQALETAYTLSLGSVEEMGAAARAASARPLLKLKLSGPGDLERVRAVREGAPRARLVVDANEAWTPAIFTELSPKLRDLDVELIEQPLPAGADDELANLPHPVPVCADESCHDRASLAGLAKKYEAVNIKLDKAGGLTEALALAAAAREAGLAIMVGCMVGTSLSMAPALLVGQGARWVDLDGPLLLAKDRVPGLDYHGSLVSPPAAALWG